MRWHIPFSVLPYALSRGPTATLTPPEMGVARYGACLLVRVEGTIVRHCPPFWEDKSGGMQGIVTFIPDPAPH